MQGVIEGDDVEPILRAEAVERALQARLGLTDALALHGAADVEDEGDVARQIERCAARWGDHQEVVVGLAHALAEEAGSGRGAGLGLPFEHEIAVREHVAVERDVEAAVRVFDEAELVAGAGEGADVEAGGEIDAQGNRVDRAVVGMEHGRRDAGGIRDGTGEPAPAVEADHLHAVGAGDVSWPDHHGEAEAEAVFLHLDGFLIGQADTDGLAGADVGDGVREDVGSLLLRQGGGLSGRLCGLVDLLGLFALLDRAVDQPVADLESETVDGGRIGEREDVDALDPLIRRIGEALDERCSGDGPADVDLDVHAEGRRGNVLAGLGCGEEKRAGAGLAPGGQVWSGRDGVGGGDGRRGLGMCRARQTVAPPARPASEGYQDG